MGICVLTTELDIGEDEDIVNVVAVVGIEVTGCSVGCEVVMEKRVVEE